MISPSFDIKEFINVVKEKDYDEMLLTAEREALESWRHRYHKRSDRNDLSGKSYESDLMSFISLLRSSVVFKSHDLKNEIYDLFLKVREGAIQTEGIEGISHEPYQNPPD
jgi:hypothetical protein